MVISRWFEKDPAARDMFPIFKGKSTAELQGMPRVKAHGTHIFSVLSELINDLKRDHVARTPNLTAGQFDVSFINNIANFQIFHNIDYYHFGL